MNIIQQLLLLMAMMFIITALYNFAGVLVCVAFRIKIKQIAIFYGKPVVAFPTRWGTLALGFIPTGGYTSMEDMADFEQRPPVIRVLLALAGPAATLSLSVLLLGPSEFRDQFIGGFSRVVSGAVSPLKIGTPFVQKFFMLTHASAVAGLGVLAALTTCVNLLPLPNFAGGRAVLEFFSVRRTDPKLELLTTFCAFAALALMGSWGIALANYFVHFSPSP